MQYLSNYFKQLYQKNFQRKSDIALLKEKIDLNPNGLFLSTFQTHNHVAENKDNIYHNFNFSKTHIFFGNNTTDIVYLTFTDLSYEYHQREHTQNFCSLTDLPLKIREQLIIHAEALGSYTDLNTTIENITKNIQSKPRCETFTFPADLSFFSKLHHIFLYNKFSLIMPNTEEKTTRTKI